MRVIITVSLSLALTFFTVSLASKKKQGDRRFNDLHYSKAILFYLKAIEKGDSTVAKNLAESCLHINQPNNAAKWYEVVIDQGEYTDRDILNYIQAVKGTGDYSKYEELTARYSTMPASDGLKEILVKNDQFDIVKTNINTIYSDCSPTFLGDSSLVFMSDRKIDGIKWKKHPWSGEHFYNLLVANITDSLSKLEGVRSLSEQINTKYEEGPATFSSDGQLMIYSGTARRKLDSASNYLRDKEVANMELYLASYDQEEQEWNTPEKFPIADSIYEMEHPYLSPDGNTLYFSSDHPYPGHQGKHDLYKVVKKGESWSDPINLGKGINTEKNEGFPFIQPKTNELYFSSDGHKGLGKLDVFVSAKKGDVYTKAINLGTPVNSYSDDFGVTFNKSMTIGYFSSNRPGGEGLDDIYGIIVNKSSLLLAGVVRDELNTPIDSAIVRLFDKEGNILDSVFTDSLGKYDFASVIHKENYSIGAYKPNYSVANTSFIENDLKIPLITKDLTLMSLQVVVTDTIQQTIILPINFEFNQHYISEGENSKLIKLTRILKKDSTIFLEIYSYTDCRGSYKYNEKLSTKRASATRDFLIQQGVHSDQIVKFVGMGETSPIKTCECSEGPVCNRWEHRRNRRSEFVLKKVNTVIYNTELTVNNRK